MEPRGLRLEESGDRRTNRKGVTKTLGVPVRNLQD